MISRVGRKRSGNEERERKITISSPYFFNLFRNWVRFSQPKSIFTILNYNEYIITPTNNPSQVAKISVMPTSQEYHDDMLCPLQSNRQQITAWSLHKYFRGGCRVSYPDKVPANLITLSDHIKPIHELKC